MSIRKVGQFMPGEEDPIRDGVMAALFSEFPVTKNDLLDRLSPAIDVLCEIIKERFVDG